MRALLIAALVMAAPTARARSLERFVFQVDVRAGRVRQVWAASGPAANTERPPEAGGARLPAAPAVPAATGLANEAGAALLRDATGAVRLRVPMSRGEYDWSPWAVMGKDLVAFCWRERATTAPPPDYREVWTAVRLTDGQPLWRRDAPLHEPSGEAAALNDRALIVDSNERVEIIDPRTGATLRALPKSDQSFSLRVLSDGLLIEAGGDLHLVDRVTGADRWRLAKQGALLSWTPVDGEPTGRALVQTSAATYLVDGRRGQVVWQAPAAPSGGLWAAGGVIYEPRWEVRAHEGAVVGLTVRRIADGAMLGTNVVQRYAPFFDESNVVITGVRNGKVEVETTFVVFE